MEQSGDLFSKSSTRLFWLKYVFVFGCGAVLTFLTSHFHIETTFSTFPLISKPSLCSENLITGGFSTTHKCVMISLLWGKPFHAIMFTMVYAFVIPYEKRGSLF